MKKTFLFSLFVTACSYNLYAQAGGTLDNTFGINGIVTNPNGTINDVANTMALQADGKIIVAGQSAADFCVRRYNTNGSLDNSFGTNGQVITSLSASQVDYALSIAIQSDGKIIVGGFSYQGVNDNDFSLVRYNPNGSLDNSFGINGKVTTNIPNQYSKKDHLAKILLHPNGKITAVGSSTDINGSGYCYTDIVKYNIDGSLDNTFGSGGIFFESHGLYNVSDAALLPNGNIIVSGLQPATDGLNNPIPGAFNIFLWDVFGNNNFSLTHTIQTNGLPLYYTVSTAKLAIQPDGKMFVAGNTKINGKIQFSLTKFNSNGTIDNTFGNGGAVYSSFISTYNSVQSVALQADGKIVLAGWDNNGNSFALARYTTAGIPDATFNSTGETSTNINTGEDQSASMAIQPDGKIIVAGYSISGANYDFALARYLSGPLIGIDEIKSETYISINPNPNNGVFILETSPSFHLGAVSIIEIYNILGKRIFSGQLYDDKNEIDLSKEKKGLYFYHIQNEKGGEKAGKIIIE